MLRSVNRTVGRRLKVGITIAVVISHDYTHSKWFYENIVRFLTVVIEGFVSIVTIRVPQKQPGEPFPALPISLCLVGHYVRSSSGIPTFRA